MLSALLIFSLAVAAQPQDTATEPAEKTEEAAEKETKDDRICRNIRPDMSSRRKQRVCMTSEEWREFNRGN